MHQKCFKQRPVNPLCSTQSPLKTVPNFPYQMAPDSECNYFPYEMAPDTECNYVAILFYKWWGDFKAYCLRQVREC